MKIFMLTILVFVAGCSTESPEERAKKQAEKQRVEAAIATRPDRLEGVSQELSLWRYTFAVIIKDAKTGQEFVVVREKPR